MLVKNITPICGEGTFIKKVFGMVRHKMQMAVFFSVIDVSKDLPGADIDSVKKELP